MASNKAPTRGPFASIHNPNPGLHYGALATPTSARELGKSREVDQGIDMALVGAANTSLHSQIGVGPIINLSFPPVADRSGVAGAGVSFQFSLDRPHLPGLLQVRVSAA